MTHPTLQAKELGIDTYCSIIAFLRKDCYLCQAEGFNSHTKLLLSNDDNRALATINLVEPHLLAHGEIGLSRYTMHVLDAFNGDAIEISHPPPVDSLHWVRAKVYRQALQAAHYQSIIHDIVQGFYSDIDTTMFLSACAGKNMTHDEVFYLAKSMLDVGETLSWTKKMVVDKHCVGGLPGNRVTPIVVSIVANYGLTIPKTSSRAITSPAGTADMMEVITNVDISTFKMKEVVRQTNACLAWGGGANLSPADDRLIQVECAMNIDSMGQMVASVLSKKAAAGVTHVVIDIPIGPSAKIRTQADADLLGELFSFVGQRLGIHVDIMFSDGRQPIGHGIGPALETFDIIKVLKQSQDRPSDLERKSITIAGKILEFSDNMTPGEGELIAEKILTSGKAWQKFVEICEAQGGVKPLRTSKHSHLIDNVINAGIIISIDNRRLAQLAKLAGAPSEKYAGVEVHKKIGEPIQKNQPLITIHSESLGRLEYALNYWQQNQSIFEIQEQA